MTAQQSVTVSTALGAALLVASTVRSFVLLAQVAVTIVTVSVAGVTVRLTVAALEDTVPSEAVYMKLSEPV